MIIDGIVERGKRLGRTMGCPTANVEPVSVQGDWPPNGVYAAALWLAGDDAAWLCMLNQGVHPTVPEGKPTVEAHMLGFEGDIYGQSVRVEYLRFLRPERRFEGLEALAAQLERDRASVQAWLSEALTSDDPDAEQRCAREIRWHMPTE